jgi:DNA uptake protein ComE-like DNA-binding protein
VVSVDWPNKIINISQSDLSLVGSGVYELDVNQLRLDLKGLEESEGIPFLDTHRHVTTVTLGGVTLARLVEFVNGYTITFEDGQYAVNLIGANNNISEVTNVNRVSIRSSNTAGLIQVSTGSGLSAEQATQLSNLAAALESAGIFSEDALQNAPASAGSGDDAATIYTYFTTSNRQDEFKSDISTINTNVLACLSAAEAVADGRHVISYSASTATQYNSDGTVRTVFDLFEANGTTPATEGATAVERRPQ